MTTQSFRLQKNDTLNTLSSCYTATCGSSPNTTVNVAARRTRGLARDTSFALFGDPRQGTRHDFPSCIDQFVLRTNQQLGSSVDIIAARTILPFYLPFRSVEIQSDAIDASALYIHRPNKLLPPIQSLYLSHYSNGIEIFVAMLE